ncbi:hypothetical protein H4Q32_027624 [Labeo rohita]|uniref:Zinc finger BED domain-containing 1-like protein n=1 Tax=Labeo rohita TaxID=84645 RepID=A0ABQ8MDU1_LABRO|nr:hypothetical protein H4Q32_027624 [Labeo rohita]
MASVDNETEGVSNVKMTENRDFPDHPWPYMREMFKFVEGFLANALGIRKHATHMETYTQLTSTALKRKTSDAGPSSKQMKFVIEQEVFKTVVNLLQPSVVVMSRGTVKIKGEKATQKMKNNLKEAMSALNKIHTEFNICEKIVCTTTDNSSNFLKAFTIYGELDENNNPESVEGARPSQMGERETETMLDQDNGLEYQLPKHHRCVCHLLNLLSTVDVLIANSNSTPHFLSLWNRSARSITAADIIKENCKLQLLRPNDTRWNFLFLAVERIVRIVREQGERAITAVCNELAFLEEYAKTMSPFAKALDVLQGEVGTYNNTSEEQTSTHLNFLQVMCTIA